MIRTVYINENYRFIKDNNDIKEGGFSRNYYLMRWYQNNIQNIKEIKLVKNRLINAFIVIFQLIKPGNDIIIFQYPLLGVPIFSNFFLVKFTNKIFLSILRLSLRSKKLIFDISDLKYEQSLDLNINTNNLKSIQQFEAKFFSLPAKFVFASESMRVYAQNKYNIHYSYTDVCNNGARDIQTITYKNKDLNVINSEKINFVYAGSLNKGRQIELMLKNFPDDDKVQMIIMGNDGDWIPDNIAQDNIVYLGPLSEDKAIKISSKCDIGLIPYDNLRSYYNIAYPTKLSFYLVAGIPFLSTPVEEVIKINKIYDVGFIHTINEWHAFCSNVNYDMISQEKVKINKIKKEFVWDQIIEKCKTYRELLNYND